MVEADDMNPIQVVVDTNVVVAAFRSADGASNRFFSMLGDPRWEMNISTTLVLEYEEALKRVLHEQGQPVEKAEGILNGLLALANRHAITANYRPLSPDPDDDFVGELAIESGATFLITFNIRDFEWIERHGVRVLRPGEFLRVLEGHP